MTAVDVLETPKSSKFDPTGKSLPISRTRVKPRVKKYFCFPESKTRLYNQPTRPIQRGCFANVTDVRAGCGGHSGARDGCVGCGWRNRVVPTPQRLVSSSQLKAARATVAKAQGSPRRARISLKPSRRESRMPPLHLYARVPPTSTLLHTRPRVQRAPGFPCALLIVRVKVIFRQTSGELAARSRTHVGTSLRGALATKQSSFLLNPSSGCFKKAGLLRSARNDGVSFRS
jgi:hypothetical protein